MFRRIATAAVVAATAWAGFGVVAVPAGAAVGDVTTIAGGGDATTASIGAPMGLARFGTTLYIGSWAGEVYARDLTTNRTRLVVPAGNAHAGDNGPAAAAANNGVRDLAVDGSGNLFMMEGMNTDCYLRRVDAVAKVITTIAGNGTCGWPDGDGGPATEATLDEWSRMAVDGFGAVHIAWGGAVRRVDPVTGTIDVVVGTASDGGYVDGPVASENPAEAARFANLGGITFAPNGDLYLVDNGNAAIRRVAADGAGRITGTSTVTTLAGGSVNGYAVAGTTDGDVTTAQIALGWRAAITRLSDGSLVWRDETVLRKLTGNTLSTIPAPGDPVYSIVPDAAGGFFVSATDSERSERLMYVDNATVITSVTDVAVSNGDGGPATAAVLQTPTDVVRSGSNLYVAEMGANRIRRIDLTSGIITTAAGTGVAGSAGDGGLATAAQLNAPTALALRRDPTSGADVALLVGQQNRIRSVDLASGVISTVVGSGLDGNTGDGGLATNARIGQKIFSVVVDAGGRLVFSDLLNHVIRCVGCTASNPNLISTIAGRGTAGFTRDGLAAAGNAIAYPSRLAISPTDGAVVFGELTAGVIRRIDPKSGVLTTIAGRRGDLNGADYDGFATRASIAGPVALKFDVNTGDLFVGQVGGNLLLNQFTRPAIRRITAKTGRISTVAGRGVSGFSGDGGVATNAAFRYPAAIAQDDSTHLYVVDMLNGRIRRIEGSPAQLSASSVATQKVKVTKSVSVAVSVRNSGAGWTVGTSVVTFQLPSVVSFTSVSATGFTCGATGQTVTCRRTSGIAPGATVTFTLRLTAATIGNANITLTGSTSGDAPRSLAGSLSIPISVTR